MSLFFDPTLHSFLKQYITTQERYIKPREFLTKVAWIIMYHRGRQIDLTEKMPKIMICDYCDSNLDIIRKIFREELGFRSKEIKYLHPWAKILKPDNAKKLQKVQIFLVDPKSLEFNAYDLKIDILITWQCDLHISSLKHDWTHLLLDQEEISATTLLTIQSTMFYLSLYNQINICRYFFKISKLDDEFYGNMDPIDILKLITLFVGDNTFVMK